MASRKNPVGRKEGIVVQEMNGEVLIYDLNENKAFCLNETSALVWEACDGSKSVSEISRAVGGKLNSPANEDLVWLALDQLKKENLLANAHEVEPNFNGMSRREVIKKVGLGTMIALPVISSLIAPTAVHAQSRVVGACAPGTAGNPGAQNGDVGTCCPCTTSGDCSDASSFSSCSPVDITTGGQQTRCIPDNGSIDACTP